eukprot:5496359-Pyramimonas_sp.AAC.1
MSLIDPATSPIEHAQSELASMLMENAGRHGLSTIWYHYADEPRKLHLVKLHSLSVICCAYAQNYWRFTVPLGDVPFEIMRYAAGPEPMRRASCAK